MNERSVSNRIPVNPQQRMELLSGLQAEVTAASRRRRRFRRMAAVIAVIPVAMGAIWWSAAIRAPGLPPTASSRPGPDTVAPRSPANRILVGNRRELVEHVVIRSAQVDKARLAFSRLTDDELLFTLENSDVPVSVARINNRLVVIGPGTGSAKDIQPGRRPADSPWN